MEIQPQFSHEWNLAALNAFSAEHMRELEVLFHPLHE
jgi:hypothetical protein